MAASAVVQLSVELTLPTDNGNDLSEDTRASWHKIEWDLDFFPLIFFISWEPQEILNHTCSTGIFVECMLVTLLLLRAVMQNLFVALRSLFVFFAVLASPLSIGQFRCQVDDKPKGGSEGWAYLFHKTTLTFRLKKKTVKPVTLQILFLCFRKKKWLLIHGKAHVMVNTVT